ncbi:hypothetical protein LWC34_30335 [Kibdelosporangium philippinense]|uniref:Uncharacterized protein n=1 Tax=Kibdelosporangium philippinense TaxID=211113 RepID=A0ABS8ZGZ5_9PSEU|nr:hypothetical protein [Kibdelosporangium philippinense]MCE7007095.1 hypothetical protein [Kibdelosporangium philippinense]
MSVGCTGQDLLGYLSALLGAHGWASSVFVGLDALGQLGGQFGPQAILEPLDGFTFPCRSIRQVMRTWKLFARLRLRREQI